jgi:hypothetical protein
MGLLSRGVRVCVSRAPHLCCAARAWCAPQLLDVDIKKQGEVLEKRTPAMKAALVVHVVEAELAEAKGDAEQSVRPALDAPARSRRRAALYLHATAGSACSCARALHRVTHSPCVRQQATAPVII